MSWRAFRDGNGAARRIGAAPDGTLRQGTLLLSFDSGLLARAHGPILRIGPRLEPQRIFALDRRRDGELSLLIRDGAEVSHIAITPSATAGPVLLAYLWHCDSDEALLTVLSGDGQIVRRQGRGPVPAIAADQVGTLFTSQHGAFRHPSIRAIALADHLMPVGPLPGLVAGSPVTTPDGPRSIETLRPGDRVLTDEGAWTTVRWQGGMELPALPGLAPVRLSAPFQGLDHDLVALPDQLLRLGGADIAYHFGADHVLVRAGDLVDGSRVVEEPVRTATIHYHALVLDCPAAFRASGALVESLRIGGLLRQPALARLSVCADLLRGDAAPAHGRPGARILAAYEVAELRRLRESRVAPVAR